MKEFLRNFFPKFGKWIAVNAGPWIASSLAFLGLSYVGATYGTVPIEGLIRDQLSAAGPLLAWIGFFEIDKAITVIISAYAVRASMLGARAVLRQKPSEA